MKISIICSSRSHPIFPWLANWAQLHEGTHDLEIVDEAKLLRGGDILFLISCHEIIDAATRKKYSATLVIHASDLPLGRGWSPHIWQILEGRNEIVVTLLEASDKVDSGAIWSKKKLSLAGHELADEINEKLFKVELELMDFAIEHIGNIRPKKQKNLSPTYYAKRTPDDSRLDANKSIAEQFDLMRVCDPDRYPAFIEYRGFRYNLTLTKVGPVVGKKD